MAVPMAKEDSGFWQVVKALKLTPKLPASAKTISQFEAKTGLKLPAELREIYEACNGLKLKEGGLEILSLETSLTWVEAFRREGISPVFGYLPFAEANDSNPFCVCCSGPMTGLVVRVFHDDSPRLMFRSVDSFFKWLLSLENEEDWNMEVWYPNDWPGEFTKGDFVLAKRIMEWSETLTDAAQTNARRFAITMLSEENLGDIIAQLEANDVYVREEAERSLRNMNHPTANAAISQYQNKMKDFAKRCIEELNKGGFAAEYKEGPGWPSIKVIAGKKFKWLNFPVFYDKRNDKDVWDILLEVANRRIGWHQGK
jgi:hypothetical protein